MLLSECITFLYYNTTKANTSQTVGRGGSDVTRIQRFRCAKSVRFCNLVVCVTRPECHPGRECQRGSAGGGRCDNRCLCHHVCAADGRGEGPDAGPAQGRRGGPLLQPHARLQGHRHDGGSQGAVEG